MENTVLTEHESACRAAHEQVQLLQHLYARLAEENDGRHQSIDRRRRMDELRTDRQALVARLKALGLLRTEPDPEREGLLGIAAELKQAFAGRNGDAVTDRLLTEECEFLRLCEQLAGHDDAGALGEIIDRTRAAVERLQSAQQATATGG